MDFRLFAAVIKRYRKLVGIGFIAAVVLAMLAYGSPTLSNGRPALEPHSSQDWQSNAEVLISQPSDPYGQAMTPTNTGAESYLASLSAVYAALANGNRIQTTLRTQTHGSGTLAAQEVVDPQTGDPLPLVSLTANASSSEEAVRLATMATALLQGYIAQQQTSANVPAGKRITLTVVQSGLPPVLAHGYDMVIPLLVFVCVLGGVVVLAFILENLTPQTAHALEIRSDPEIAAVSVGTGRNRRSPEPWRRKYPAAVDGGTGLSGRQSRNASALSDTDKAPTSLPPAKPSRSRSRD